MSPLQSKVQSLVAGLNAGALEALANKGLLRRAQKDLERGVPVSVAGEANGALRLQVEQFTVSLPEAGPAKATCSCPATGVCQHILTAILFLQQQAPAGAEAPTTAGPPPPSADAELIAFTREQLEGWAGKAGFRAGLQTALESMAEVTEGTPLVVRFPLLNLQCHYAGGGLDGIIVAGRAKDPRSVAVAAVIAFQKHKGVAWESTPGAVTALEASEGAPRTRAQVVESALGLLGEMLANGLARLSPAPQQRLATLAVSGLGVNLPRLSLALRGLADECALVVKRDARSDLGRTLERMALAYALCFALRQGGDNPRADLVGWHRTRYQEIGHLDLIGAAAWPWRTASGYEGLTVLFWDPGAKRWNSWTESRPKQQLTGFSSVARYTQPGPWEGAESPRQLARSAIRLLNARRNAMNRLSASTKSRVLITGQARLGNQGPAPLNDWAQLVQRLESQAAIGLREADPLDAIVLLQPVTWAGRMFDGVTQTFCWILLDVAQRPLGLELRFDDLTEPAIKYLETVPEATLAGARVIGRAQRTPQGLSFYPFCLLLRTGESVNLLLDTAKARSASTTSAPAPAPADEEDETAEANEEWESAQTAATPMSRLLSEVEDASLALAEAGASSGTLLRAERLRQLAPRAERFGLKLLARALAEVATDAQPPLALLRCAYITQLHRHGQ